MQKILLSGKLGEGKYILLDDEDADILGKMKWHLNGGRYPVRGYYEGKKKKKFYLHRVILNAKKDEQVDHINGNKLDCRKENLRICTSLGNNHNRKRSIKNTSGYKGVTYHKRDQAYQATIKLNYKEIFLGYFKTAKEAAIAYNDAAKKYYGEFAWLNTI